MGTAPLDLKVEQMSYGLRVPFILPTQNSKFHQAAYSLNQDPPGMMRVMGYWDNSSLRMEDAVSSYAEGHSLFPNRAYLKVGGNWHVQNPNGTLQRESVNPKLILHHALDALLNESVKRSVHTPTS